MNPHRCMVNNVSAMGNVSEYWFLDHYRIIVARLASGKYLLSVDVYRRNWVFEKYDQVCIKNYCLLYAEIDPSKYDLADKGVSKIIVTGLKYDGHKETINVRYIMDQQPTYPLIERLFYQSWRIIGCGQPVSAWETRCPEEENRV